MGRSAPGLASRTTHRLARGKRRVLVLLVGSAILALATSCGSPSAAGAGARSITGQVEDYAAGAALLRATVLVAGEIFLTETVIGTGSIAADGGFDFVFDSTVDAGGLTELFSEQDLCDGVTASANAQGGLVSTLEVTRSGSPVGVIGLASGPNVLEQTLAGGPPVGTLVAWLYVDRDVAVSGTCTDGGASYDLVLTSGWNMVEIAMVEDTLRFRSVETATGVEWHFLPSTADSHLYDVAPASHFGGWRSPTSVRSRP